MKKNKYSCPKCGEPLVNNVPHCEECEVVFRPHIVEEWQKLEKQVRTLKGKKRKAKNACPQCGGAVVEGAEECKNCGVIFEKYFAKAVRTLQERKEQLTQAFAEENERKEEREEASRKILAKAVKEYVKKEKKELKKGKNQENKGEEVKGVHEESAVLSFEEADLPTEDIERESGVQEKPQPHIVAEVEEQAGTASEQIENVHFINQFGDKNFLKMLKLLRIAGWGGAVAGVLCFAYSIFSEESILLGVMMMVQGGFGCILIHSVCGIAEKVFQMATGLEKRGT